MREIARMKDHVIICGAGRTGRQVAQELEHSHDTTTWSSSVTRRGSSGLRDYIPDVHVIEGDATHDQVLLDAGLREAQGLITCLSADADNLFVCLSARDLAAQASRSSRAPMRRRRSTSCTGRARTRS